MLKEGKRGQLSILVIVALLIVLGVGGYFALRGQLQTGNENTEFSPIFGYYDQCIQQYAEAGLSIAASQGGRIEENPTILGSDYAPFGNQLSVSGLNVPYWMTVSGNGIIEENVPTQTEVENELSSYIESRLSDCDFDEFRNKGWDVSIVPGEVETNIASDGVLINVGSSLVARNENGSASRDEFKTTIKSNFGSLFNDARHVYDKEQTDLFIENYSFDVLQLYAPVDGVEIQCSPKIWTAQNVFSDLKSGLSANLESIKFTKTKTKDYFSVASEVENNAQILYDQSWPSRFEVYGNEGNLLVANPIGNQQGLQALGFCYVPYHFTYDMMFPVLVRITSEDEFFQFPVVIVIDKNTPRNGVASALDFGEDEAVPSLCAAATQNLRVSVRSSSGSVKNATVNYGCFDQSCPIGVTNSNGVIQGLVPACLNGFIDVNAEGYAPAHQLFSSHNSSDADIRLDQQYSVKINVSVDGKNSNALTFVSFEGDHGVRQAVVPESRSVSLAAGFYNLTVYQYGNASIRIPATTSKQCLEVSAGGLRGVFGATREQCFDVPIPETVIDKALTAGGQGEVFLPEELLKTGSLIVNVHALPKPTGIDSLETNYALFETQGVDVQYG
jgi:hypothetical protein